MSSPTEIIFFLLQNRQRNRSRKVAWGRVKLSFSNLERSHLVVTLDLCVLSEERKDRRQQQFNWRRLLSRDKDGETVSFMLYPWGRG